MSRVAKNPIPLPTGVECTLSGQSVTLKGPKGELNRVVHPSVAVKLEENVLSVAPREGVENSVAHAGTARALLNNMSIGVHTSWDRKLELHGVGYKANVSGKKLVLNLGYSHPVEVETPEGITFTCPSATEIIISGIDKQKVGQVAADIRSKRPPEPYKGKGVRYADEVVRRKEVKKK